MTEKHQEEEWVKQEKNKTAIITVTILCATYLEFLGTVEFLNRRQRLA